MILQRGRAFHNFRTFEICINQGVYHGVTNSKRNIHTTFTEKNIDISRMFKSDAVYNIYFLRNGIK